MEIPGDLQQCLEPPRSRTGQPIDPHALAGDIRQRAHELGFNLVGITSADPSAYRAYLRQWLDDGRAGTMQYLADRFEERTNPAEYFPGARSIICLATNYHVELTNPPRGPGAHPGKIARYALSDDYHEIIKDRLHELADWLRDEVVGVRTCSGVDTVPVMEKELAARAGLGWIGKNTCVINPDIGSWILLSEIITTLDLPVDQPSLDRCGSCTRCIDACPTAAITAPYELDARKCISYLTIEHRADMPSDLQPKMGDWIYGCDICQDVCPWNRRSPISTDPLFQPRFPSGTMDCDAILSWDSSEYTQTLRHSAMKRVKLPVLQRNAAVAIQNIK